MGLLGILVGLALLVLFAFRGWSVLLLAPAAALVAAALGREPLLANWTQVFMGSTARFLAQFFPIFSSRGGLRQTHGRQPFGVGRRWDGHSYRPSTRFIRDGRAQRR